MTNASFATDTNAFVQNPFFNLTTKILNVYSEAIRQNMENLTVSSAKIIQEETIRAWENAAQSCSKALTKNAMLSQQQAMERITSAHQKAFGMLVGDLNPFKLQPIGGLTAWLPSMTSATSKVLPSNLVKSSSSSKRERRPRQ